MGRIRVVPCIVLFNGEGKVLVLKRSSRKRFPGKWELPGGSLRFGESPREAACREVKEETGFLLDPSKIIPVDTFGFVYGGREGVEFIIPLYAAKVEGEPVLRPDEHEDWCWMSLEELKGLEERGEALIGVYKMALRAAERMEELGAQG